jgi:arabinofuranosyltransferase
MTPPLRWHDRALALSVVAATYAGYRAFWFLTDDAFIAFRYASNLAGGRGLVWNPAPFAPVEGYTSFLWTVGLAAIWKVTGVAPPDAANWISLGCGLVTLWLVARLVLEMPLPSRHEALRRWLLGLALLGTLTNRTFFTWLSSGLETSLFNLLITWWILSGLRGQAWRVSTAAALLALTRPDGLLFAAVTPVVVGVERRARFPLRSLAPLGLVVLHLAWRLHEYGEWVPNTYFAKHVGAWPAAGLRYAASFAIEYGVWVWAVLALACLARLRKGGESGDARAGRAPARAAVVAAAVTAHVGYYTLIVGGDHFEYRVYSHLVPLLFASAGLLAAWAFERRGAVVAGVAAFVLASWPLPWLHWRLTKDLSTRSSTAGLFVPLAPHVPPPLHPLATAFDGLQQWLIAHFVCVRHQEHKVFWEMRARLMTSRLQGGPFAWSDHPVMAIEAAGLFGWYLPDVAIVDRLGLSDRIIAHSPVPPDAERRMAHDRSAPPGYVECFRPDVTFDVDHGFRVVPRATPLTDADIVACEDRFSRLVHLPSRGAR